MLSIIWRAFGAWSNLEFIGQKSGVLWDVTHFVFATQTGANILMIVCVLLLVGSLLFRLERQNDEGEVSANATVPDEKTAEHVALLRTQLKDATDEAIKQRNEVIDLEKRIAAFPCPDDWLHKLAEFDSEHISTMVRVVNIYQDDQMNTGVVPYYVFSFEVVNDSVYPVVIDFHRTSTGAEDPGTISFKGHPFVNKLELVHQKPTVLWPREGKIISIRVKLEYPKEVNHIESGAPNHDFIFTGLKLDVRGLTTKEKDFGAVVKEGRLNTNYGLRKERRTAIRDYLAHYS